MSTPQRHTERIAALRRILQRHITVRTMIGWALPACYALFILGLFLLSSELHDPKVWFKDSASIRDLLVSIAAVGGVPFLIWREWNTHRTASAATHQAEAAAHQAEIAEERHQRQTEADQQRRIIDLFGKAIELLGKEELETRLGAIYALERIAHESQRDYWPIMETLTAYVRSRHRLHNDNPTNTTAEPSTIAVDAQAILTVISRRNREYDPEDQRFDLSQTRLQNADLHGADLTRANLTNANLTNADLTKADLTKADLRGANLTDADLTNANLTNADLTNADLRGANLTNAGLTGANLTGADLTRAYLRGATLTNAGLTVAKLTGANLTGADLRGAKLTNAGLTGATLTGADLRGADLRGADLTNANLTDANLTDANLTDAKGLALEQSESSGPPRHLDDK